MKILNWITVAWILCLCTGLVFMTFAFNAVANQDYLGAILSVAFGGCHVLVAGHLSNL